MEGGFKLAGGISVGLATREGRRFGVTVGSAIVVLGGIAWWRNHEILAQFLIGIGVMLLLGALVVPLWLKPIERWWMAVALQISRVTTPVILGIVYFMVVTPIALVIRGIRGNPLEHPPGKLGYWFSSSTSQSTKTDMRRQF